MTPTEFSMVPFSFDGFVRQRRPDSGGAGGQRPGGPVHVRRSWRRVMRITGQVWRDARVVTDAGARSGMVVMVSHRMRGGRGRYVRVQIGAWICPV